MTSAEGLGSKAVQCHILEHVTVPSCVDAHEFQTTVVTHVKPLLCLIARRHSTDSRRQQQSSPTATGQPPAPTSLGNVFKQILSGHSTGKFAAQMKVMLKLQCNDAGTTFNSAGVAGQSLQSYSCLSATERAGHMHVAVQSMCCRSGFQS